MALPGGVSLGFSFSLALGSLAPMRNSFPPPSIKEDEVLSPVAKIVVGLVSWLLTSTLFSVMTHSIIQILEENGAIDWSMNLLDTFMVVLLVQAIRALNKSFDD